MLALPCLWSVRPVYLGNFSHFRYFGNLSKILVGRRSSHQNMLLKYSKRMQVNVKELCCISLILNLEPVLMNVLILLSFLIVSTVHLAVIQLCSHGILNCHLCDLYVCLTASLLYGLTVCCAEYMLAPPVYCDCIFNFKCL